MINQLTDISEISFDDSYKNLFQVDDARLRADALKHSVVPRLRVVLNGSIAFIKNIYNLDALEDSRVSCYPNFRPKRENELTLLYQSAYASLGGKRDKEKWRGFNRKGGKVVQLLPFRYGYILEEEGLYFQLENYWLKGLTDESHKKLFDFHLQYESLIHSLCYRATIKPLFYHGNDCEPISTLREHYDWMTERGLFDNFFVSEHLKYPIAPDDLNRAIEGYVIFYPIYDSYIQIAMGKPVRFLELVGKLNKWLKEIEEFDEEQTEDTEEFTNNLSEDELSKARIAAEQQIKVMPSIRWQVFQRDNWKCVACGRDSHDDIILHVDHIIPRSKGGQDTLENFQTLCHVCNIGKSNKDTTDLRRVNACTADNP
ncbi:MAG: HNH endonuclease [Methylococcales bacterium]|nr:HNH endonuclease [Methylococcales bacterium]